ncbi:MAG: DUF92 domain-containing protein [Calditrichaeota bacterium]|nr:MAG: DUF92 domain-containing protein [Calditrichota bacterium]
MDLSLNVPQSDWLFGIILFSGLTGLIVTAEIFYVRFAISKENIRKLVHVLSGVAVLSTPLIFETYYALLVISALFTIVNLVSVAKNMLNSYNATERKSLGTVYYPISVILLTLLFWHDQTEIFYISFALLAFADAAAGFVGKSAPPASNLSLPWDKKSRRGAVSMFLMSFTIILAGISIAHNTFQLPVLFIFMTAVSIALLVTAGELLSLRGSDNLSIPLLAAMALSVIQQPERINQFFIGVPLALIIALAARRLNALDLSGALATFILGVIIFGYAGWLYTIPILFFFLASSTLSHLPNKNNLSCDKTTEPGAKRNVNQVLANGLAPLACIMISFVAPHNYLYIFYLAALASATADTWATEIGLMSKTPPRSITSWKSIEPGMSGGITMLGIFGALAGAGLVTIVGYLASLKFAPVPLTLVEMTSIIVAGLLAQFVDSLFGAMWQRKNRCVSCGKITERNWHCKLRTAHFRGKSWLNNDAVNLICGFSGLFFIILFHLIS